MNARRVAQIVAVTRRPLGATGPKLREVHCEDFIRLDPIAADVNGVDACFYCLGTSSSGVSPAQYRVITLDYALESARLLKMASPSHTFHFVSGAGTRADSRFHWARVKGETISGRPSLVHNSLPPTPGNPTRRPGPLSASTRWNAWRRWSLRVTRPAMRNTRSRAGSRR